MAVEDASALLVACMEHVCPKDLVSAKWSANLSNASPIGRQIPCFVNEVFSAVHGAVSFQRHVYCV